MKTRTFQFAEYGQPTAVLQLTGQDLPDPGPGQALVKIKTVGLNRSELNYTLGRYVPAREFPSGVGQEAVGEIVALGPPVEQGPAPHPATPLTVGARVALLPGRVDICGMGAYREVGLYDQAALAPVPDHFSDEEGAAYWMAILTMGGCLELAGLNPGNTKGKKVLVTAATSSMGIVALQLAKAWGAETLATSRSADKAKRLEAVADHVIVCNDSDSLSAGVNAATDNQGVDVSLDPLGADYYAGLLAVTANGGEIVSYEMITGPVANVSLPTLMINDLSIHGFTIFRVYKNPALFDALIRQGMEYSDQVRPIVSATFPLEQAPTALAELGTSQHIGKLVLLVS
ncbi:MAG: zinc-binding dehydrogenase [Gammaproteobacteria bacterium]|jgi:NADPH:quinone reductase-like Zn-dependent oxidoreductase|nr:zinc-binding dehydrogenase [Gammaproteobacteria bacterium]